MQNLNAELWSWQKRRGRAARDLGARILFAQKKNQNVVSESNVSSFYFYALVLGRNARKAPPPTTTTPTTIPAIAPLDRGASSKVSCTKAGGDVFADMGVAVGCVTVAAVGFVTVSEAGCVTVTAVGCVDSGITSSTVSGTSGGGEEGVRHFGAMDFFKRNAHCPLLFRPRHERPRSTHLEGQFSKHVPPMSRQFTWQDGTHTATTGVVEVADDAGWTVAVEVAVPTGISIVAPMGMLAHSAAESL